jgi:hypothetical protein
VLKSARASQDRRKGLWGSRLDKHRIVSSMEQERPPPAYAQHKLESFHLPTVPTHIPHTPQNNGRLPGIKSLDLPDATTVTRHTPRNSVEVSPRSQFDAAQWGHLPTLGNAALQKAHDGLSRSGEDVVGSPMSMASVLSADEKTRRETSVSMDDPDVRLAAEALSGLGNPGTWRRY